VQHGRDCGQVRRGHLRVEAAAWQGRLVFFALVGDWNKPGRMVTATKSAEKKRNRDAAITTLTARITILLACRHGAATIVMGGAIAKAPGDSLERR
jgi:hypothetical protein